MDESQVPCTAKQKRPAVAGWISVVLQRRLPRFSAGLIFVSAVSLMYNGMEYFLLRSLSITLNFVFCGDDFVA
jgi:hypothetical protein